MNKITLSINDIKFIFEWAKSHEALVRNYPVPVKNIKIICPYSGHTIVAIRNEATLEMLIKSGNESIGKFLFSIKGEYLYREKGKLKKIKEDDLLSVISLYCNLMALMAYGEDTSEKDVKDIETLRNLPKKESRKKKGKKQQQGVTYILKQCKDGRKIVPKGSHASPQGSFTVRGHFRHYKSGKVVWVNEFMKGKGKVKDKKYKLRKDVEK